MSRSFIASLPGYFLGTKGPSGFSSKSTAEAVAKKHGGQIKGRVYIVTGANCGLGKETARVLSDAGGHVFMACRSQERMAAAREELLGLNKEAKIDTLPLDLSSLRSIEAAVEEFEGKGLPLHCLINNAGVAQCKGTTQDGAEMQFGINVMGTHHLTTLLLPLLKRTGTPHDPSRVVTVASSLHGSSYSEGIRFKNLGLENFSGFKSYGQSKLGNVLYTRALAKQLGEEGAHVITACLHPGVIPTELGRDRDASGVPLSRKVLPVLGKPFFKTVHQGAATSTYLASAPAEDIEPGKYYADCNVCPTSTHGDDDAMAQKLFDILPQMVQDPTRVDWE